MAHKGYTLNYFIDFFKSIPDHRWTTGEEQKYGTVQHCALGHVLRNSRTTFGNTNVECKARASALQTFLGNDVVEINDATPGDRYYSLGSTPRGRILKALRNRKRTGQVLG